MYDFFILFVMTEDMNKLTSCKHKEMNGAFIHVLHPASESSTGAYKPASEDDA